LAILLTVFADGNVANSFKQFDHVFQTRKMSVFNISRALKMTKMTDVR